MDDLRRALLANRDQVERAVASARAELAECEDRCSQLRTLIGMAESLAELDGGSAISGVHGTATLHEAMKNVLTGHAEGLRASELAAEINRRGLYRKKTGEPIDAGQIHARAGQYESTFTRQAGRILLRAAA